MSITMDLAREIYESMTEPTKPITVDSIVIVDIGTVDCIREAAREAGLPAMVSETACGIVRLLRFLELMRETIP
jgi:hypothetical protein